MNNKIYKFRAWDTINQKMLEEYPSFDDYGTINDIFECHADYLIPLEYTGLKDKNGREIYEGDIIKSEMTIEPWEIIYDENQAKFIGKRKDEGDILRKSFCKHHEVIGNIYENPELLGGKE